MKEVLMKGDCLERMKEIPDESVDIVLTDPPYEISKPSNFHTMEDRKNGRTGTNFGAWDYDFSNDGWIRLCAKKLKKGGSLIGFNDFRKATTINNLAVENGLVYKDTLIWHKTNAMPRNRDRRFITNVEMMQLFVKPKAKWTFNRQHDSYESSVLSFASESGGGYTRYHPTQKPIKLITYLLNICSNKGDVLLDPFMGSGTTGVACKNLNRKFIGIELDQDYFNIAKKRIEEA